MKKYYFIVLLLIIVILIFYKIGVFERLNLINNKIVIHNNVKDIKLTKPLKVLMPSFPKSYDTTILFEHNILKNKKTQNWYGKDHIIVIYKDNQFMHSFNDYKFNSWEKITYRLDINSDSSNYIILSWVLYTQWCNNAGTDRIKVP